MARELALGYSCSRLAEASPTRWSSLADCRRSALFASTSRVLRARFPRSPTTATACRAEAMANARSWGTVVDSRYRWPRCQWSSAPASCPPPRTRSAPCPRPPPRTFGCESRAERGEYRPASRMMLGQSQRHSPPEGREWTASRVPLPVETPLARRQCEPGLVGHGLHPASNTNKLR